VSRRGRAVRTDRASRICRVRAFAKINLTLSILGRRADGYHELRTTLQSVALHDTLTFFPERGPFRFECDDPGCPNGPDNLVWRAAENLHRAALRKAPLRNLRVVLRKRIPLEAGLGGGSSDAGAAIRGLAAIWRLEHRPDLLVQAAAETGSDVPFFLAGGTALGLERGDLIFPLMDQPSHSVVIALPPFGVSTRDAYAWFAEQAGRTPGRSAQMGDVVNDLQDVVAARHPQIGELVRLLVRRGAVHAAMSGSGSAVFGLFASDRAARAAAKTVERMGVRYFVTRTLSRRRYDTLGSPVWVS
jgi:4-diphosphocytidyl-2-C-methyl-D-erythritol kinase